MHALLYAVALGSLSSTFALPSTIERRAEAYQDSPSYAPSHVACPSDFKIRTPSVNGPLSTGESNYIKSKTSQDEKLWAKYLDNVCLKDFDKKKFFKMKKGCKKHTAGETLPNFGIAASGGGLRALLNGGSVINAFDSRNPAANKAKTGGVLQLANYLVGLSGGSWLISSIAVNDFPTTPALNQTVWDLGEGLLVPRVDSPGEYAEITASIAEKQAAGFPVSFVDFYGRALSYHFVNDTEHGRRTLFNGIRDTSAYKKKQIPFPITVGTSQPAGSAGVQFAGSIYEFNAEEFGIFDPSVNAFVNMKYMGTSAVGGKPTNSCVQGFDNAGFIFGISSDIFGYDDLTQALAGNIINSIPGLRGELALVPGNLVDTGRVPNSFRGLGATTGFAESSQSELNLLDGGLAGENIPFWPLQQPSRNVDAIIAIDSSADTNGNYPNGTAPYTTYLKSELPKFKNYPFPAIPEAYPVDTFLNEGLNQKPSFFGCNEKSSPLVVYLPNYNQTFNGTGTSTFQQTYTPAEINGFFDNGFAIGTQSKGSTVDKEWPACLACALVDRQSQRQGMKRTKQCSGCFQRYCA